MSFRVASPTFRSLDRPPPAYRLPYDAVDLELRLCRDLGVRFELGKVCRGMAPTGTKTPNPQYCGPRIVVLLRLDFTTGLQVLCFGNLSMGQTRWQKWKHPANQSLVPLTKHNFDGDIIPPPPIQKIATPESLYVFFYILRFIFYNQPPHVSLSIRSPRSHKFIFPNHLTHTRNTILTSVGTPAIRAS